MRPLCNEITPSGENHTRGTSPIAAGSSGAVSAPALMPSRPGSCRSPSAPREIEHLSEEPGEGLALGQEQG